MTQTDLRQNGIQRQDQQDDTIDLKKVLFKLLRNWHWFVLAIAVTGAVAFLYNRYTTPIFEIKTSVLVEEEKAGSPLSGSSGMDKWRFISGFGYYEQHAQYL